MASALLLVPFLQDSTSPVNAYDMTFRTDIPKKLQNAIFEVSWVYLYRTNIETEAKCGE
jgi:hypothetical protein